MSGYVWMHHAESHPHSLVPVKLSRSKAPVLNACLMCSLVPLRTCPIQITRTETALRGSVVWKQATSSKSVPVPWDPAHSSLSCFVFHSPKFYRKIIWIRSFLRSFRGNRQRFYSPGLSSPRHWCLGDRACHGNHLGCSFTAGVGCLTIVLRWVINHEHMVVKRLNMGIYRGEMMVVWFIGRCSTWFVGECCVLLWDFMARYVSTVFYIS